MQSAGSISARRPILVSGLEIEIPPELKLARPGFELNRRGICTQVEKALRIFFSYLTLSHFLVPDFCLL